MRGFARSWKSVVPRVRVGVGADRLSVKRKTREGMMVSGSRRWAGWRGLFVGVVPSVCGVAVVAVVACVAVVVFGGGSWASAAISAPAYLGEVAASEFPGETGSNQEGSAVDDASGDVYFANEGRVLKLSPYGTFILEFGKEVDLTQVERRKAEQAKGEPVTVTVEQEDVCVAASGDRCGGGAGAEGTAAGQFAKPEGVAVEQATGDVYVVDRKNHRVQKFNSSGQFLLMFGREVNKTAVEEKATRSAEENVCPAAGHSTDVCQVGTTGGGEGQFETWRESKAAFLAVGGPSELVYVGDKGRIQEFNSAGLQQKEVSTTSLSSTGKINALAVDSAGNVYFSDENVEGVRKLEAGGTLTTTPFASTVTGKEINALALDSAGHIYVSVAAPALRVLEYELAAPSESPAELPVGQAASVGNGVEKYVTGLAVDPAGTVYMDPTGKSTISRPNPSSILLFGSLAAMEAKYGAPPQLPPLVVSTSVTAMQGDDSAMFSAVVNPKFLATTYQFEYGSQPCSLGGCVDAPVTAQPVGERINAEVPVSATVEGLLLNHHYYYRAHVVSSAGGAFSKEGLFVVGEGALAGAAGLPDGRVYEQVTPLNKYSHEPSIQANSDADGEALLYYSGSSGPFGGGDAGYGIPLVSRHASSGQGWVTDSATPPPLSGILERGSSPEEVIASDDFSQFVFKAPYGVYSEEEPPAKPTEGAATEHSVAVYKSSSPSEPALWLGKPTTTSALPEPGHLRLPNYWLAGASPDLSRVFFTYTGTLVGEDASRIPHIGKGEGEEYQAPWGFYEWSREGGLLSAGVLPDGSVSQWGAIPAGIAGDSIVELGLSETDEPADTGNQVVAEGARALFVSPDPWSSTVTDKGNCTSGTCTTEPPQLYMRIDGAGGAHRTVLVSRSQLSGHEGEPAPDGVIAVKSAMLDRGDDGQESSDTGYGYASINGARVFFQSDSRLTEAAPESSAAKEYVLDAETGALAYVPGVVGPVVAASADGSRALIENTATSPAELDLWNAEGEDVTWVAQLPEPESVAPYDGHVNVEARATGDGSVFVLDTNAPLPAGFNNGGGYSEVYRYETASGSLECVSCAPTGTIPVGNAEISHNKRNEQGPEGVKPLLGADTRVISASGDRVFFDTPTPLVPGARNGHRDVYEWENGNVYLISSGTSSADSFYLDSSESGNDVFFATTADLSGDDVDEAYDIYDARVPRPGEAVAASNPCEGVACHPGSSSSSPTLTAPPSATFTGLGNLAPASPLGETKRVAKTKAKAKAKKKRKKKKKKAHGKKASVRRRTHESSHGAGKGRGK